MIIIYAHSSSKERYVAEGVSKQRFIKAISLDLGRSEGNITVERTNDEKDFNMVYNNYRKIVKYDSESGELLKII